MGQIRLMKENYMNKKSILILLLFFVYNAFGDSMRMDYCKTTKYYNTQATEVTAYKLVLIKATVQIQDSLEELLPNSSFIPHPFKDATNSKSISDLSAISAIPEKLSDNNDDVLKLFIGIPYDNVYSKEVYYVTK